MIKNELVQEAWKHKREASFMFIAYWTSDTYIQSSIFQDLQIYIKGWKLYGILNFKICQGCMVGSIE